jgi:heptaprenyl diphosphate synthase/octaprenyl-diphosphate synthase
LLKEYGYNLGIAFQIVDDILDFIGTEEELGKPVGSDLAQGTLTLPAMLLLQHYPEDNPVRELFDNRDMPEEDKQKKIKQTIELIRNSSIVQQCYQVASDYCVKARHKLGLLPDNPISRTFVELIDFVVSRKK